jgi:putative transcriptional regulator, lysR family
MYYSKYSHPFDIGFGTLLSDHDDLEKRIMARLPMRLVVSKQNPLSEKDKVAPADYKDEDFILLSHDMLERKLTDTLTPDLTEDQVVGEISSTQVALRMVKRNAGVHITDLLAAISVSDDCKAIPIDVPLTIPFSVFWPKSEKELSDEAKECITEIAESIKKVGIPLTSFGKSFLSKSPSNQAIS